jgi:RecB family exonuclease
MQQGPRYVKQWANRGQQWDYIELDVSMALPSGILIKGYVDRVRILSDKQLINLVDQKSGSTRPDSDQQLGVYSVLLREWLKAKRGRLHRVSTYAIEASNYMFKDDEFYEMNVSNWTLQTVDELAQEWYRGLESGVFLPNRGKQCGTCGVAGACFLASGDTATTRSYDKLNPNYGE